jgi:hypothetical protein
MDTEENQATSPGNESANLLDDLLMSSISEGTVIPIISNSLRIEGIFRSISALTGKIPKTPRSSDEYLTINEQLTREWADSIQYPLPDDHNLARVAQYFQVHEKNDIAQAKTKYLNFLKMYLLENSLEQDYQSVVAQLKLRTQERTFSDIVSQLEYPRFSSSFEDPLRQLANLPLPIYVTTSYYNFLERALELAGKLPRTQVCSWSGGKARRPEHLPDPNFLPTPENPAVYHLFGLENYPPTLVLSEDDYMNFLISVAEDTNTQNPGIPLRLREALAESRLILLGYNLQDWEFRVLFRFILKFRKSEISPRSTVIQLKPRPKKVEDEKRSLDYLYRYFDIKQFGVKWTSAEHFIHKLTEEWDKYTKGVMA